MDAPSGTEETETAWRFDSAGASAGPGEVGEMVW